MDAEWLHQPALLGATTLMRAFTTELWKDTAATRPTYQATPEPAQRSKDR